MAWSGADGFGTDFHMYGSFYIYPWAYECSTQLCSLCAALPCS